jgi:uncharacterized Fe-S cluster-containing radical SAM superfamily protein
MVAADKAEVRNERDCGTPITIIGAVWMAPKAHPVRDAGKRQQTNVFKDCSFILNRFHGGLVTAHRFLCNKTCYKTYFWQLKC